MHEEIVKARKRFVDGQITLGFLEDCFWSNATPEQKEMFWRTPTYDRHNYIIGNVRKECTCGAYTR